MPVTTDLTFDNLYREYRPRIYRYLVRLLGGHEAEDLTQDVLAKVSVALKSYEDNSRLSAWLYKIATNVAIDRVRARQAARETTGCDDLDSIAHTESGWSMWSEGRGMSPGDEMIHEEMNSCVREVVSRLPDIDRTIIVLSEMEDFSDQEIAAILSIKVGAVKVRLHRARGKLRQKLESVCDFYHTKDNTLACCRKQPGILKIDFTKRKSRI